MDHYMAIYVVSYLMTMTVFVCSSGLIKSVYIKYFAMERKTQYGSIYRR